MARYSKVSQQKVKKVMEEMKEGKLKSGRSGKKVTNPKQAIAIGLSEARKKGAKVPDSPKKSAKKAAGKKSASKKSASEKDISVARDEDRSGFVVVVAVASYARQVANVHNCGTLGGRSVLGRCRI